MLFGKKVAFLVADGFEEVELTEPRKAVCELGAEAVIVSPKRGFVRSWTYENWGDSFKVDRDLARADASEFDGLVLPGGVLNPDKLRTDERALVFIRAFFESGKPVAAICHGLWPLIDAQLVRGRRMTSYRSLRTDLINAGAHWVSEPVVVDRGLITSRAPSDLIQFNQALCEELSHETLLSPIVYREERGASPV